MTFFSCCHARFARISRKEKGFIICKQRRYFKRPHIPFREGDIFRLPTRNATIQVTITKQCRGSWYLFFIERSAFTRIGIFAGGILLHSTEKTVATRAMTNEVPPVAFLQIFYVLPGFNDFPHKFMTKNIAMFNLGYFACEKDGGQSHNTPLP